MAGKRVSIVKLEEVKRFSALGLSERQIAKALGCSRNTIKKFLRDSCTSDVSTEAPIAAATAAVAWMHRLDWKSLSADAARGTPIQVLWEELKDDGQLAVNYPAFWKQLRKRFPDLAASMHRVFKPGERAEIDYSDGIDVFDSMTGARRTTQLFVGVLCHSRSAFAEFTWSQKSCDFLSSHVRMLNHWGGVPSIISPDNLKSAVSKAHWYDPEINPEYARLAMHYNFAVVPARVRHPKDKAIVERTIQIFQRWFYFRIRNTVFYSLEDLNIRLRRDLVLFEQRVHRIFRRSRAEMFAGEQPHLASLPSDAYVVSTSHEARVHPDCHLAFDHNHYSAPHQLRGMVLRVWATATTVEIYSGLERVAFHARSAGTGKFSTDSAHYPPAQQAYAEAIPSMVREQARRIGPMTADVVTDLLSGSVPLQYLRRAQGIVRLEKKYGAARLEKACKLARELGRASCRYIEGILQRSVEEGGVPAERPIVRGENPHLRGDKLLN